MPKQFFKERIPYFGQKYRDLLPHQRAEVQHFWASPTGLHIRRCRQRKANRTYIKRLKYDAAGPNVVDPHAEYFDGEKWKHDQPKQMTLEGF